MTTTTTRVRSTAVPASNLRVDRRRIRFQNTGPDQVRITVEVGNAGPTSSLPCRMRIDAAPFGAFLPWRRLTTLTVPSLQPGETTRLVTTEAQAGSGTSPGAAGIIPRGLLTAIGANDENAHRMRRGRGGIRPTRVLGVLMRRMLSGNSGVLPPNLLELLAGPQPHWAGNLNIWIESRPVERHLAPRLRVHAGRANLAMFCIGGHDDYAFRVEDQGLAWRHSIFDLRRGGLVDTQEYPHSDGPWHSFRNAAPLLLVLRPPVNCPRGQVDVCVTQRSSGRTAHVEFDLDPLADGPGCFRL